MQKIKVVGEPIAKHVRHYKLADNIDQQLVWMTPPKPICEATRKFRPKGGVQAVAVGARMCVPVPVW